MAFALSIDTNIIVYALNRDCEEHDRARLFLSSLTHHPDVVLAEQTLIELYLLLRNPAVFKKPLPAREAVEVCKRFRNNPAWRAIECREVMSDVWKHADHDGFPRRRILDISLALTLISAGVLEFATRNVTDFEGIGFKRVFNPID